MPVGSAAFAQKEKHAENITQHVIRTDKNIFDFVAIKTILKFVLYEV